MFQFQCLIVLLDFDPAHNDSDGADSLQNGLKLKITTLSIPLSSFPFQHWKQVVYIQLENSSAQRVLIVILLPYEPVKSYGMGDGLLIIRASPELLVLSGHQEKQEGYQKFQNVPGRFLAARWTASMDFLETEPMGLYWINFSWGLLTPSWRSQVGAKQKGE